MIIINSSKSLIVLPTLTWKAESVDDTEEGVKENIDQ